MVPGAFHCQSIVGGRSVDLNEGVQVGRIHFSCCFVSKCQGFEFDAGSNWEPVEGDINSGVTCCFGLVKDQTHRHVLDHL